MPRVGSVHFLGRLAVSCRAVHICGFSITTGLRANKGHLTAVTEATDNQDRASSWISDLRKSSGDLAEIDFLRSNVS